jgi:hypothetical protein
MWKKREVKNEYDEIDERYFGRLDPPCNGVVAPPIGPTPAPPSTDEARVIKALVGRCI